MLRPAGAKLSEEYGTEYSTDKIEIHVGAVTEGQRVLLVGVLASHRISAEPVSHVSLMWTQPMQG